MKYIFVLKAVIVSLFIPFSLFADIPLRISKEKKRIYLKATFDGQPLNCLLNTGQAKTEAFHKTFLNYLSKEELDSVSIGTKFNEQKRYKYIKIKEIRLGEKKVENLKVKVPVHKTENQSCVLGIDFFLKLEKFGLNFKKNILSYDKGAFGKALKKFSIEAHEDFGLLFKSIKIRSSKKKLRIVFDTGLRTTTFDVFFVKKYSSLFTPLEADSTVKSDEKPYRMKSFKVDGFAFPVPLVAGKDFSEIRRFIPDFPMVFIGFNSFSSFNWFFNLKEGELFIYSQVKAFK